MAISLRVETPEDEPFLRDVILKTIAEKLGSSFWPEPVRSRILGIQYSARRNSLRTNFSDGESLVIMLDDRNVGWLYMADRSDCLHLAEIMLEAEFRGKGIGSALIARMIVSSNQAGKPLRLGVDASNAGAIRLYERFGFRRTGGDEVQLTMEHSLLSSEP